MGKVYYEESRAGTRTGCYRTELGWLLCRQGQGPSSDCHQGIGLRFSGAVVREDLNGPPMTARFPFAGIARKLQGRQRRCTIAKRRRRISADVAMAFPQITRGKALNTAPTRLSVMVKCGGQARSYQAAQAQDSERASVRLIQKCAVLGRNNGAPACVGLCSERSSQLRKLDHA